MAASPDYVSWHQDIAYWGLDPPEIVTAWVALTEGDVPNSVEIAKAGVAG
jgi:ectoine hydroxylase-related dioxygenase (phytanoyl-CoA dioxygenase family)